VYLGGGYAVRFCFVLTDPWKLLRGLSVFENALKITVLAG